MLKFLTRKLGMLLALFVGITVLSFCLIYLSPSDPAEIKLNKTGVAPTQEMLELTREEMGLNRPVIVQYGSWLIHMVHGDMGTSLRSGNPVISELQKALPKTMALTLLSMLMVLVFSIPLGILCAKYRDSIFDNIVRFITYLFVSMPSFFLALLFLYFLCVRLGWFTVIAAEGVKGMLMPALVLALSLSAWYIRQVRVIILEELGKDYIVGARARGVPEGEIMFGHVLYNALLPILTLVGITFAGLLGGATIVETIFSWPGLGKLAMDSISARDYPVIQGYVLWMAMIFVIVNFIVDFSYGLIDPRVRKNSGKEPL